MIHSKIRVINFTHNFYSKKKIKGYIKTKNRKIYFPTELLMLMFYFRFNNFALLFFFKDFPCDDKEGFQVS